MRGANSALLSAAVGGIAELAAPRDIGGMLGRIRRSASFGRAGSSSSDRAPRIDRSASLLSAHELDLLPGPAAARLPPTSSSTVLPSPRPRLAPLQGMLLKRHRSSKWTKWGRRPC